MLLPKITYCPSSLKSGFDTYSQAARKRLFNGKSVSHVLPFHPPQLDESIAEKFRENRKTLSISGAQIKISLVLDKNMLRIAEATEQSQYILKPIPHREQMAHVDQLPANEHLTMQIARQVYGINTAENAIIFFQNGEPAYITKRFDVGENGLKTAQEDFATLLGKSQPANGPAFKNEGSYEAMARVLKTTVPAYAVEIEKFFSLVLFNYLFSNGDAHLKNFSVQATLSGDHILSPAYDLLNSRIHLKDDSALALKDGLFEDDFTTPSFEANGFYAYDDFHVFGLKIGMMPKRVKRLLDHFRAEHAMVKTMIDHSFLSSSTKETYVGHYEDRLRALNYSMVRAL